MAEYYFPTDDTLMKEIQELVLQYLSIEDKEFILKRDRAFTEITKDFSCDIGKVNKCCVCDLGI